MTTVSGSRVLSVLSRRVAKVGVALAMGVGVLSGLALIAPGVAGADTVTCNSVNGVVDNKTAGNAGCGAVTDTGGTATATASENATAISYGSENGVATSQGTGNGVALSGAKGGGRSYAFALGDGGAWATADNGGTTVALASFGGRASASVAGVQCLGGFTIAVNLATGQNCIG